MKRNKMSETAQMTAVVRAGHFAFDDPPKIFEDPYAADLIASPLWSLVARSRILNLVYGRLLFRWARPIIVEIILRARYAEDCLEKAMAAGIDQYVILGAGLDSFALRRRDLEGAVKIFELDHPDTQAPKRHRLEKLRIDEPGHLEFVPVNFEKETLADGLARSSFSAQRPAFFSWMGVVHYLSPKAVVNTLNSLAAVAAPGSEIVFDYSVPSRHVAPEDLRVIKLLRKDVSGRGEPLHSIFDPDVLPDEIGRLGFELIENVTPPEQESRYLCGRQDYPRTFSGTYFAHFRLATGTGNPSDKPPV